MMSGISFLKSHCSVFDLSGLVRDIYQTKKED